MFGDDKYLVTTTTILFSTVDVMLDSLCVCVGIVCRGVVTSNRLWTASFAEYVSSLTTHPAHFVRVAFAAILYLLEADKYAYYQPK